MLDVTRIRYFQAVAEAGSFSRAAKRLGVSQPTLSIQVARLEDELEETEAVADFELAGSGVVAPTFGEVPDDV